MIVQNIEVSYNLFLSCKKLNDISPYKQKYYERKRTAISIMNIWYTLTCSMTQCDMEDMEHLPSCSVISLSEVAAGLYTCYLNTTFANP